MNPRKLLAAACLLCPFTPAVATYAPVSVAKAPAPADPYFGPLPPFKTAPGKDPSRWELMWRMNQYMAGERVMAVGDGEYQKTVKWSDDEFKNAKSIIVRLQMIADKHSIDTTPLMPYKEGAAYVLAPQDREQIRDDLANAGELDLSGSALLCNRVLLSVPESRMAELGTDNGIAVSSLPREMQSILTYAFRPPMNIWESKPEPHKSAGGVVHTYNVIHLKGRLEDPIDWSAARVRARLKAGRVFITVGEGGRSIDKPEASLEFGTILQPVSANEDRDLELPFLEAVPNTYKPSDLTGKGYDQPLKYGGVWTVEQVVQQIAKVAGLKLYVAKTYKDESVFIGSDAFTEGEAIDGLRLALTAAWRKVDGAYVLCWDRIGIQGFNVLARESTETAYKAVKNRQSEIDKSADWLKIVDHLPFDKSNGLYLTDDQRKAMFAESSGHGYVQRLLHYSEMTPEQREWVASAAANDPYHRHTEAGVAEEERPYTDQEIQSAYVWDGAPVEFSVYVPGTGWVNATGGDENRLTSNSIAQIRRAAAINAPARRSILDGLAKEDRDPLEHPQPTEPSAKMRALMVPPLRPARLKVLADEMKRHGLNTLFYPVLYDGYSTFESKAFPLNPALGGADGWAAAIAEMAPAGIKVIGYLQMLAWQEPADKAHCLSKHADWIDTDALGRPRSAWFIAHPEETAQAEMTGMTAATFVRATEPMVIAKLKTLIDEFSAKPGSTGICFTEWDLPTIGRSGLIPGLRIPALGFGYADRVDTLRKTGLDPLDACDPTNDIIPPSICEHGDPFVSGPAASKPPDAHQTLMVDLLRQAKSARKDWKTWVVNSTRNVFDTDKPVPDAKAGADEVISDPLGPSSPIGGRRNGLLPMISRNGVGAFVDALVRNGVEVPDALLKMPPIVWDNAMLFAHSNLAPGETAHQPQFDCVVFDFRSCPNEITSSLHWIK